MATTTFQSGNPLPISDGREQYQFVRWRSAAQQNGDSAEFDGSAQQRLNQWFNTSAFYASGAVHVRQCRRARCRTPARTGIANFDFTVFKNTTITERVGLQFRTEIFNLFNRVRFGYPGHCARQSAVRRRSAASTTIRG